MLAVALHILKTVDHDPASAYDDNNHERSVTMMTTIICLIYQRGNNTKDQRKVIATALSKIGNMVHAESDADPPT